MATNLPIMEGEVIEVPQNAMVKRQAETHGLAVWREPEQVLVQAQHAAEALQKRIAGKKKPVIFNGEQYIESDDWEMLAHFFGYCPKGAGTEFVQFGDVKGFKATSELLNESTGMVVGRAESMCLDDEDNWGERTKYEWKDVIGSDGKKIWLPKGGKNGTGAYKRERVEVGSSKTPLFQLLSMAQTRANAKVIRNKLAWVVTLAGYRATPAEEMIGDKDDLSGVNCPECNTAGAIIKGKEEYGGGFVCFKRKGGCGAKFETLPGEESAEPESQQSSAIKFAGKVVDLQRPVLDNPDILVVKIEFTEKGKTKAVILASEVAFVTFGLQESYGKRIEALCSEQPGKQGRTYYRIEKLISVGGKPPAVDKGKVAADNAAAMEAQQSGLALCTCKHPAAIHLDGKGKCSGANPKCRCTKFAPVGTQVDQKVTNGTKTSAPAQGSKPGEAAATVRGGNPQGTAPAAATPVKQLDVMKPIFDADIKRSVAVGGKVTPVDWIRVTATVVGTRGPEQTSQKKWFMGIYLGGLPESHVKDNIKRDHNLFIAYHTHIIAELKAVKPGDTIMFEYERELAKGVKDPKLAGNVRQNIELLLQINGRQIEADPDAPFAGAEADGFHQDEA